MRIYKSILILLLCIGVSGCASKTVEEAFKITHKKAGQEIVYQGSVLEKPFILYKAPFDNGKLGIGVAVFDGSAKKGWTLSAGNAMYNETDLLIDQVGITFPDQIRRHLIYGSLDNPEISKVEMLDKNNQTVNATILETNWKRLFYGLVEMNELRVKAYDKSNRVVFEVPYSK